MRQTHHKNGRLRYDPKLHERHCKPWTTSEIKYILDFYNADGRNKVSLALGRTQSAVSDKASQLRKAGRLPIKPD